MLPETVAGPDLILSTTLNPEVAAGTFTVNGASPYVLVGIAPKLAMLWEALFTAKLVVTSAAEL
jgi:hypothetical protein